MAEIYLQIGTEVCVKYGAIVCTKFHPVTETLDFIEYIPYSPTFSDEDYKEFSEYMKKHAGKLSLPSVASPFFLEAEWKFTMPTASDISVELGRSYRVKSADDFEETGRVYIYPLSEGEERVDPEIFFAKPTYPLTQFGNDFVGKTYKGDEVRGEIIRMFHYHHKLEGKSTPEYFGAITYRQIKFIPSDELVIVFSTINGVPIHLPWKDLKRL